MCQNATPELAYNRQIMSTEKPSPSAATTHTRLANTRFAERLNFDDAHDFELASRGLIAAIPDDGIVKNARGRVVWNLQDYAFLEGDADIASVNPSLLRMARLNMANGLFKVAERVYQIRGIDLANMTIVEADNSIVIIDCLTTAEVAEAGLELYYQHRTRKPVSALMYTHSHVDHFGGAKGVLDADAVAAGKADVFAPDGFLEAVGGENVLAGNAMTRRAQFQFGPLLKPGPHGQVDAGLGKVTARGTVSLIEPTRIIKEAVETHHIDGLEVQFHLAPGTEAPAEMHMFFPELGVLNMAENATPLLHNFCPLRGSEVRDPRLWSHYLADAVERFGDQTDVLICQHHWPTWGRQEVIEFLEQQRDLYKFIHDQTVRMMNLGMRPTEIAEVLDVPPSLAQNWRTRGYYGTVSHNSKAVFQRYLSWYDGHPANLNPLPPREAAEKYLSYMGGAEEVVARAQEDYDNGEYRWVAQVLYHVLFAQPDLQSARELAACAFDQLGYQAESATWRNAYLYAAQELREGVLQLPPRPIVSPDLLAAVSTSSLFGFSAVRLDAQKALHKRWQIVWDLTDRSEVVCQTLCNETLSQIVDKRPDSPDASVELTRETLVHLVVNKFSVAEAIASGAVRITGDVDLVSDLFAMLDHFDMQFDIVAPAPATPEE